MDKLKPAKIFNLKSCPDNIHRCNIIGGTTHGSSDWYVCINCSLTFIHAFGRTELLTQNKENDTI